MMGEAYIPADAQDDIEIVVRIRMTVRDARQYLEHEHSNAVANVRWAFRDALEKLAKRVETSTPVGPQTP